MRWFHCSCKYAYFCRGTDTQVAQCDPLSRNSTCLHVGKNFFDFFGVDKEKEMSF